MANLSYMARGHKLAPLFRLTFRRSSLQHPLLAGALGGGGHGRVLAEAPTAHWSPWCVCGEGHGGMVAPPLAAIITLDPGPWTLDPLPFTLDPGH